MAKRSLFERLSRLAKGAKNAVELLREGRLGPDYAAAFTRIDDVSPALAGLLRYPRSAADGAPTGPILLVPPLMVTAAIYDISPELSAVAYLAARGADVWLCDFGTPEDTPGGLDRTLDDHVLAVSSAIDRVRAVTGHDVHLVGYSQGGLFCYQAAAFRKSAGLASIVAFGAPVDIHRNTPLKLNDAIAGRLVSVWRRAVDTPLTGLRALPGTLSSRGFKLMAPLQEVKHLVQLLGLLPDREAFALAEPKRRFLGGEGFIAWPGPALRTFIDDFVVQNRLKYGGFVIAGRTTALADITCPILYAIGEHDDLARPVSVMAIARAAPHAATYPLHLAAGHFGLVVGGLAMAQSWPTVLAWAAWHDGVGPRPELLTAAAERSVAAPEPDDASPRALQDWLTTRLDRLWSRLGAVGVDLNDFIDRRGSRRRQRRLDGMSDTLRVSFAGALSDRAKKTGAEVFFVWQGRAYTYAAADERVSAVARELVRSGVARNTHVGLFADVHPDVLSALGAANRLGAIAVPIDPALSSTDLTIRLQARPVDVLIVDAAHVDVARQAFAGPRLTLSPLGTPADDAPLPPHDQGRGGDVAIVLAGHAAPIRNRDQVATALAAAIALQLGPSDTVYSPLPLHAAPGLLIGVGAGLVGGARLALSPEVDAATFWGEVRNIGATVVVLDRALATRLLAAAERPEDRIHPVRVFVDVEQDGVPGLDAHLMTQLVARFSSRPDALRVQTCALVTTA